MHCMLGFFFFFFWGGICLFDLVSPTDRVTLISIQWSQLDTVTTKSQLRICQFLVFGFSQSIRKATYRLINILTRGNHDPLPNIESERSFH